MVGVDIGWGSALNIARTIRELVRAGVTAVHIEDPVVQKRCGHRPNKAVVSTAEMRITVPVPVIAPVIAALLEPAEALDILTQCGAVDELKPIAIYLQRQSNAGRREVFELSEMADDVAHRVSELREELYAG